MTTAVGGRRGDQGYERGVESGCTSVQDASNGRDCCIQGEDTKAASVDGGATKMWRGERIARNLKDILVPF